MVSESGSSQRIPTTVATRLTSRTSKRPDRDAFVDFDIAREMTSSLEGALVLAIYDPRRSPRGRVLELYRSTEPSTYMIETDRVRALDLGDLETILAHYWPAPAPGS